MRYLLTPYVLRSEQCLKSIYESITFVFTDLKAFQMFLGYCQPLMEDVAQKIVTPPAFLKYARTLELSLSADFPSYLACARPDVSRDLRHEVYDFHWLRLDLFQNLQSLNIWISARAFTHCLSDADQTHPFTGITELDTDALEQALSHLRRVPSVTLSTPLAPSVGPKEEGFLDGVKTRVYKRGEGDRFHPPHYWTRNHFDSVIETSIARYVLRLASVLKNLLPKALM